MFCSLIKLNKFWSVIHSIVCLRASSPKCNLNLNNLGLVSWTIRHIYCYPSWSVPLTLQTDMNVMKNGDSHLRHLTLQWIRNRMGTVVIFMSDAQLVLIGVCRRTININRSGGVISSFQLSKDQVVFFFTFSEYKKYELF